MTYNSAGEIDGCLTSVKEHAGVRVEVLVLDNNSSDDTPDIVATRHPDAKLFTSSDNLGFAAGVNALARQSTGTHLLLLNPDAELREGSIEALVELAERRPSGGLYGGRCLTREGELNPESCWGPSTLWDDFCFGSGLSAAFRNHKLFDMPAMSGWKRDSERSVAIITGCLVLAPRAVWDELGGFDEDFWLYGEDADLSERAWEHGYRPMITPNATITHDFGTSSPSDGWRKIMTWKGKATIQFKHHGRFRARLGVALLVAGVWLRSRPILDKLPGRENESATWAEAWSARDEWRHGFPPKTTPPGTIAPVTTAALSEDTAA